MTPPPYVEGHDLLKGRAVVITAAAGAGIGTSLYRPGDRPEVVGARAAELVRIWHTDVRSAP